MLHSVGRQEQIKENEIKAERQPRRCNQKEKRYRKGIQKHHNVLRYWKVSQQKHRMCQTMKGQVRFLKKSNQF